MLNQQKPEPFTMSDGYMLEVMEIFPTIQGEGPFTGHGAIFIRLAGCNLQCPGCDTVYTGPNRTPMSLEVVEDRLIDLCKQYPAISLAVITGGEPLRQNIGPLVRKIIYNHGLRVQLETNGVLALPPMFAGLYEQKYLTIVVSPKTSRIHDSTAIYASAFKYVLSHNDMNPDDGLPIRALGHKAVPHVARPPKGWSGPIYVNPCDSKDPETNRLNMHAVADSCMRFGYIAGVQLHKIIDLP